MRILTLLLGLMLALPTVAFEPWDVGVGECDGPYKGKVLREEEINQILQNYLEAPAPVDSGTERPPNLCGSILNYLDLRSINMHGANLSGTELTNTDLTDAFLYGVDLSGADLTNAILVNAEMSLVDLSGANLFEANLSNAELFKANLSGSLLDITTIALAPRMRASVMAATPSSYQGGRSLPRYPSRLASRCPKW